MEKFINNKEEFIKALETVLDTLGLPADRVHALSTAYYQTQGLGELYDITSYSSYIATREMFPITAEFRDSLLKWTKVTDVPVQSATPSQRWFTLLMNIDDVLSQATLVNANLYRFVIPYTTEIYIDEYTYSLDYDIFVQIFDPQGKRAVTAQYDIDGLYNPISDIVNPNIKVINQGQNIIITLPLKQYKRRVSTYRYIDSSTDVMYINYEDQLVDFTPYYRVTEYSTDVTRLEKSQYYSRGIPDSPTIYYSLNDKQIVLTNRGYRGNFLPARDSSIELSMYLTKGNDGNFQYIGTDVKIGDNEGNELPFYIEVSTDENVSVQGISEDTIEDLRKKTIDALHTRDSLITEYDLNLHYASQDKSYKIVKTRDDWVTRVYSIYSPLYDNNGYLVPTNTINVQYDLSLLENDGDYYKVPETGHIYATSSSDEAVFKTSKAEDDVFDYGLSTILCINKPARVVEAYEMYIDRSEQTSFEYNYDKSAYSFMVNRLYISREPNSNINFKFNIMTNLADENNKVLFHTVDEHGTITDTKQMICSISFEASEGNFVGHIRAEMKNYIEENDMYEFEAELTTDFFIKDKRIGLTLRDLEESPSVVDCPIKFTSIKIVVQDNGTNTDKSPLEYGVPEVEEKALINVFSLDNVDLIKQYIDISGIQLRDDTETKVTMLNVPLFGYDYVKNNGYSILNKVYTDLDYINTKYLLTQTNFVNNYKFANTYGKSRNFIIGNNSDRLDSVNVSMKFKVGLAYNSNVDLDYVRDFIVSYFKGIDFLNNEAFHLSDLIRVVRDSIPDVTKIEFVGINNYSTDYQYIVSDYDVDDPLIIPEIINIPYDANGVYQVILQKI